MNVLAYARRQDDSAYILKQLLRDGYDRCTWVLHEDHSEYDVCDLLDGKIFSIEKLVSDLKYNAPIFETSHVQCLCRLICYSTTNKELDHKVVDWKGDDESGLGRVLDKGDKRERSKDFYRLYDEYRNKFDDIRNDKYLTGKDSEPDNGLYTFNIVMDENYYYNQAQRKKISDEILNLVLNQAKRFGLKVEDANLTGNQFFVQLQYPLSVYDFSKADLMDITWTLEQRRTELMDVMHELDSIKNWLTSSQNAINNLLIDYEMNNKLPEEIKTEPEPQEIATTEVEPKAPAQPVNKDLEKAVEQNKPNIVEPPQDKIKSFDDIPTQDEQDETNDEDESLM